MIELLAYLAQLIQIGLRPDERLLGYIRQALLRGGSDADFIRATIKSLDFPQLERLLRRGQPGGVAPSPDEIPGKTITLYKAPLPAEAQARVAADSLIARYLSWLARNPCRRAVALTESDRHVVLFVPEGSQFDSEKAWREFVNFVFSGEELVRTFVAMLNSITLSKRGFSVPRFPIVNEDQQIIVLAWILRSVQTVENRLRWRERKMVELESALEGLSSKQRHNAEKEIQKLCSRQDDELKKYRENFGNKFSKLLQDQQNTQNQIQKLLQDQQKARDQIQQCSAKLSNMPLKPARREKVQSNLKEAQLKANLLQDKLREAQLKADQLQGQLLGANQLFSQASGDPFEFLSRLADQHPQLFKRMRILMEAFTERAAQQINLSKGDYLSSAVVEIMRLTNELRFQSANEMKPVGTQKFELRPLLLESLALPIGRSPGDGTGEFCYVCGELLSHEDEAEVDRFVFRKPYQRLQSVRGEQSPPLCRHCVAIGFVSPLKPSDQSVIIRLEPVAQHRLKGGRSAAVLGKLDSFLRGLTLSQLDLAAGNYLMLTSNERVKVGNKWRNLSDVVGAVVYAHLRLANLFDPLVFADYNARIVTGISDIKLEPHRLAFLSILLKSLQLPLTEGSEINRPLATATRYVLADEPVLAIYELVSQPEIDPKRHQEKVRIEIEKSLEVWTTMIGNENRAKMIADVVAMAGLLYPFVDQTLREVRKKNDPKLDPDREASKLIEEVDEVFNFIYRFADNTTYSTARLYRNPTNWFTYEQTKVLLEKLGIDAGEREKNEGGSRFLEVNPNDVEAAYKEFAEGDYKGDADWRAFTYRLKLALYSRFPGLGVKKEKSQ
jgi:hypothetical protein